MTKIIKIEDLTCKTCKMVASLNEDSLCYFCRPRQSENAEIEACQMPWRGLIVVFAIGTIIALLVWSIAYYEANKKNKLSKTEVKRAAATATVEPPASLVPKSVLQLPDSRLRPSGLKSSGFKQGN